MIYFNLLYNLGIGSWRSCLESCNLLDLEFSGYPSLGPMAARVMTTSSAGLIESVVMVISWLGSHRSKSPISLGLVLTMLQFLSTWRCLWMSRSKGNFVSLGLRRFGQMVKDGRVLLGDVGTWANPPVQRSWSLSEVWIHSLMSIDCEACRKKYQE